MAGATLISGKDSSGNYRTARIGDDGHLGSSTGTYQDGAGTVNGNFSYIFAHTATVLTSITSNNLSGTLTNIALPAGSTWRCCSATQIVVSTGEITAYNI